MSDFFLNYGLFLAKTLTVLGALGGAALIVVLARRGGSPEDAPRLEVKKLNDRYEQMADQLRDATLSKAEAKAREKARRKEAKAKAKAEKALAKKEAKQAKEAKKAGKNGACEPANEAARPRVFVLDFKGDIRASAVTQLRAEVTSLLTMLEDRDEVLLRLENPGGTAHEHGLAASQLLRLRERGTALTIAVDKVAASGGYMMACTGSRIIAAPFAILGSIGVLMQLPNFYRLLNDNGVEFEMVKGGAFKRTLTMFGENSEADRDKAREEVEDIHALFKEFVSEHRPQLDIERVATGEHWFGRRALALSLCDEIKTSDDYLLDRSEGADLYTVRQRRKKTPMQKLTEATASLVGLSLDRVSSAEHERRIGIR